jgi:HK97 family phage major capsid protein/HK97 family phage prohead protease
VDDFEIRQLEGLRAEQEPGRPPRLVGYAIRTNVLSEDLGGFREIVAPEAVTRALERRPDLVALHNHDSSRVLGRLSAQTLRVAQDADGLRFEIDPVPRSARDLVESVRRGDVTSASFAFRTLRDDWDMTTEPPTRTLLDMEIREISVVAFPAFPQTTVALRSLQERREEHRTMPPTATVTPPTAAPTPDPVPPVAPTLAPEFERALSDFSLRALIAGAAGIPGVEWGRERELSQETARRAGRTFQGYAVPLAVFRQPVERRQLTAAGDGGDLVGTTHRGDLYIDRLRAALVIRRLGARVLTGLLGNVDIPRGKDSATSAWVGENTALSPSELKFDKVSLTPKHVGCLSEYSRNMLLQASPEVEELFRADFAEVLARAVDAAAIQGGATDEPDGILSTAGIGDVAMGTNGGAPTWAKIVDLIAEVETKDAAGEAFLTNFKVVKKLRTTLKSGADTASNFIMTDVAGPRMLAGYPLAASSLVPSTLTKGTAENVCSALLFGNFSDLILGYWSELDILVNPYDSTAYPKGNVLVRGFITMDVAVRHPASFAAIKDLLTT